MQNYSKEAEAGRSIKAIDMISDALPGVGIVAAVLGIMIQCLI